MSGIPQGFGLGLLLFLLYIIGLEEIPLSAVEKIHTLCRRYSSVSSLDDHHLFKGDLNAITSWRAQNSMTLNSAKCKYMLVSRKACPHSLLVHPLLLLRGSLVSNIWEYIYLLTFHGQPTLTQ